MDAKDKYVYKLTRADGSSSYHGDMQGFLRRLDNARLVDLYPGCYMHQMKMMNMDGTQLIGILLKWKLYEVVVVHISLWMATPMEINMLVEKKFPLIKELLRRC
ncbi:hypothetical protein Tco_0138624 [Tanacetum coccineum]